MCIYLYKSRASVHLLIGKYGIQTGWCCARSLWGAAGRRGVGENPSRRTSFMISTSGTIRLESYCGGYECTCTFLRHQNEWGTREKKRQDKTRKKAEEHRRMAQPRIERESLRNFLTLLQAVEAHPWATEPLGEYTSCTTYATKNRVGL